MEKSRYELFDQVLKRFYENGLLDQLVIVGSWCIYLYRYYFNDPNYSSGIRTRDLDFVVVNPEKITGDILIKDVISDLGFIEDFKGNEGFTQFLHPELMLEFLIADKGKTNENFYIPKLHVNAQPLRYIDFLISNTIIVHYNGLKVVVPNPANFALHKVLISSRRNIQKGETDKRQGIEILKYMVENGNEELVKSVLNQVHEKWKKEIIKILQEEMEFELVEKLN